MRLDPALPFLKVIAFKVTVIKGIVKGYRSVGQTRSFREIIQKQRRIPFFLTGRLEIICKLRRDLRNYEIYEIAKHNRFKDSHFPVCLPFPVGGAGVG